MDVRCEKCGTEYELDETRLKPGGVTVKCTSCGHMFKIRKRASTNVGMPATAPVPAARPGTASGIPRPQTQTGSGPNSDRNWIIRLTTGETRTCRELATLQQWILAGEATRDAMISRSGKTWKQLGDIPELAQFFALAEEAGRKRRESARVTAPQQTPAAPRSKAPTPDVKATLLGVPAGPIARRAPTGSSSAEKSSAGPPPPPPKAVAKMEMTAPAANDAAPPDLPTLPRAKPVAASAPPPAPAPAAPHAHAAPHAPAPPPAHVPAMLGMSASVPKAPAAPQDARATGGWATSDVAPLAATEPAGPLSGNVRVSGPQSQIFGGQLRAVPTHDVAFASSLPRDGVVDSSMIDEETGPVVRGGGGLGKWIAVGSLALIAGAAAAIYFIVIRQSDGSSAEVARPALVDAMPAVVTPLDGATTTPIVPEPAEDPLAQAMAQLHGDTRTGLEAAATQLAEGDAASEPARLAMRARIAVALAQQIEDEATLTADARKATALRKDATKHLIDALALAQKAVKSAAGTPAEASAQVALADVLRLQRKSARDVEKKLTRALELAPDDREALLVRAMLLARDGKGDDARAALRKLDAGEGSLEKSGDVRPRFRLAMLAFARNDVTAAQDAADDVIAAQAEHGGARLLLARLREAVVTTDPMPPEDRGGGQSGGQSGKTSSGHTGKTSGGGEPAGDDYDALLAKADKLAEVNCAQAMPYYQKALSIKPNGVAALTGRGYCYLDAKEFASAHSSFRAALGVSRRYEPALWGIAELYQQQGLKEKAIEAFMQYLETYPGTQKAIKQIERLGGSVDGSGGGEPAPPPPPPEPDEPAPSGGGDTTGSTGPSGETKPSE